MMKTKSVFAAVSFGMVVLGQAGAAFGLDIRPAIQCPQVDTRKTQLCLALDGSGSISGDNYKKIKKAVADAIRELQHPGKPVNVAGVRRTDLPPAADWPNGVLRVSDLDILAVSNGAAWIRQDTGGPI